MARRVALIGGSVAVAQAALTLAELGVEVTVISPSAALGSDNNINTSGTSSQDLLRIWPLLVRAASHPRINLYTNSRVDAIAGKQGRFTIQATRNPRYVREDLCTSCGRCEEACSVKISSLVDGRRVTHTAIHAPLLGAKAVPSAYCIDKGGISPCQAACPLGINVQGFTSLLAKCKVDKALSLINEAAPLAGVLGRVCTHPCEDNCKRGEVDSPVFIQALHRYAADNAIEGIHYSRKAPASSRKAKIAIVGSGPAGLAAAWELARRGYSPTIFESRGVVGGLLATGIPRFRLPREVRQREVEAIEALGVDIKTGITIGRDVTFSDLRERGYRAFFLAIGSQLNNMMNIPGEDLDGVVDSMSLLFALNLKVGASVGSNMVVIGGGNSAVDSARTAKRKRNRTVRILYRRSADEMTAVKEEVAEAIKEGISIEYLTAPVEILGDGAKVTGLRCQRMALGEMDADGRRRPEPIPDSEFVIDADHVVVAIGQRPNTSLLNMKSLKIDSDDDTITVDQLTLETNVPSVFAGGDCITGPNNVVEAVAAGLRAAESIDRYLRGRDLREGRSLEKPQPAEVDVKQRDASPYKRARMPLIHHFRRMGSFEETSMGLPAAAALQEAERCLNCALCGGCMECEQACELGAVLHSDAAEPVEIKTEAIINFLSGNGGSDDNLIEYSPGQGSLWDELARASAVALEAALKLKPEEKERPGRTSRLDVQPDRPRRGTELTSAGEARIGVVLCRCGGSIDSVVDFKEVASEVQRLHGVLSVQEVSQACSEEGARQIEVQATEWELGRVVLAACRCCNLDQICFSCSDRRVMCQQHLSHSLALPYGTDVEFVNIREQCAWVHTDDPAGATRKAIEIISSGIARAKGLLPAACEERPMERSALVIGTGLCGLAAARDLAAQGYAVAIVSGPELEKAEGKHCPEYFDIRDSLLKQIEARGINISPWPQLLELAGSPGSYEAVLRYRSKASRIGAGALIMDLTEIDGQAPPVVGAIPAESRLSRILAPVCSKTPGGADSAALRGLTIKETAGIFIISPNGADPPEKQIIKGAAAAARASAYLHQGTLSPRATAVTIDSKLCRGCGDCAAICPYIEMRECGNGMAYAYVDQALCLGCGACIARCPTGAITQHLQSDRQLASTLEALLGMNNSISEAV